MVCYVFQWDDDTADVIELLEETVIDFQEGNVVFPTARNLQFIVIANPSLMGELNNVFSGFAVADKVFTYIDSVKPEYSSKKLLLQHKF